MERSTHEPFLLPLSPWDECLCVGRGKPLPSAWKTPRHGSPSHRGSLSPPTSTPTIISAEKGKGASWQEWKNNNHQQRQNFAQHIKCKFLWTMPESVRAKTQRSLPPPTTWLHADIQKICPHSNFIFLTYQSQKIGLNSVVLNVSGKWFWTLNCFKYTIFTYRQLTENSKKSPTMRIFSWLNISIHTIGHTCTCTVHIL